MVDGGMVRAAAHSGDGTGRTGAVRSAYMTLTWRLSNVAVKSWTKTRTAQKTLDAVRGDLLG